MGGLRDRMRTTYWVYLVGALAIAGIPPLAGFWSKDEILADASHVNFIVYLLLTIAALLTAFYMGRQIILVFFGKPRSEPAAHAEESPAVMTVPLIVLAFLSIFGGFINIPGLDALGKWLENTIHPIQAGAQTIGEELARMAAFNPLTAGIATLLAVIGLALAWYLYNQQYPRLQELPPAKRPDDPLRLYLGPVFYAFERRWWIDEAYNFLFVRSYKGLARWLNRGEQEVGEPAMARDWVHDFFLAGGYRVVTNFIAMTIDLGFVDALFNIVADSVRLLSARLRRIQTGYVSNYALGVFLGVVIIVGYLILRLN